MDPPGGQDAKAGIRDVRIRGPRLLLRALQPGEIEEEWQAMVTADPMVIAELPEEAASRPRSRDRVTWKMAGSISPSTWTATRSGASRHSCRQAGRSPREPSTWGSA